MLREWHGDNMFIVSVAAGKNHCIALEAWDVSQVTHTSSEHSDYGMCCVIVYGMCVCLCVCEEMRCNVCIYVIVLYVVVMRYIVMFCDKVVCVLFALCVMIE